MKNVTITFIGGGNMAASLVGGLLADGYDASKIWVAEPDPEKRAQLQARHGVHTVAKNRDGVAHGQVLVLAVKPQIAREVALDIAETVAAHNPLVISIVAGVRAGSLQDWLGGRCALVRAMPNTPALVATGASGLFANATVSAEQKNIAESILRAVGITVWVEKESDMDIITALSGSGPAYFFYVMEALQQAAMQLGLAPDVARLLTLQTALGAARMAVESPVDVAQLRQQVTSPRGTTESALAVLTAAKLPQIFADAIAAATHRADELAQLFGQQGKQE